MWNEKSKTSVLFSVWVGIQSPVPHSFEISVEIFEFGLLWSFYYDSECLKFWTSGFWVLMLIDVDYESFISSDIFESLIPIFTIYD